MNPTNKLKVGVDMDGVIARHDFGETWFRLRKLKEKLFKKTHLYNYYYPSSYFERLAWKEINKRRMPFIDNDALFQKLVNRNKIQFFLITGRFKFLEQLTFDWLKKHELNNYFNKIMINTEDIEPQLFKSKAIRDLKINCFIDDDLETIRYLRSKTKAHLFWIVPNYQDKNEKKDNRITACNEFSETLKRIDKLI